LPLAADIDASSRRHDVLPPRRFTDFHYFVISSIAVIQRHLPDAFLMLMLSAITRAPFSPRQPLRRQMMTPPLPPFSRRHAIRLPRFR